MLSQKIEVIKINPVNGGGNLRAFVDIRLTDGTVIRGLRIVQQPGQKAWVSPPQRDWKDDEGKRKWAPVVEFPPGLKEAITTAVLNAFSKSGGYQHG